MPLDAPLAADLLSSAGVRVYRASEAPSVHARLAGAIQSAAFNVTSLAGVAALIHKRSKITAREIAGVREHFAVPRAISGAGAISGGNPTGFPSQYFGVAHAAYSPADAGTGVQASVVDFINGIARPAQGPQSGGAHTAAHAAPSPALAAALRESVAEILAEHSLSASKSASAELVATVAYLTRSLVAKLSKQQGSLTLKKLEAVLESAEFGAFH
jgi:hypothetical protein